MSKDVRKSDLKDVLASLIEGDTHSFDKVYSMYYEAIATHLLNYTSDRDAIKDVVQDTFLVLWDTRKKLSITTSLKGYLYKIAYNKLMQKYRKSSKHTTMLMSYYHQAISDTVNKEEENTYLSEQLAKLNHCLELLPKRCKEVFIAKKIGGLKHKAISENLEISIKTIEGHITKAYILLRNCMRAQRS